MWMERGLGDLSQSPSSEYSVDRPLESVVEGGLYTPSHCLRGDAYTGDKRTAAGLGSGWGVDYKIAA